MFTCPSCKKFASLSPGRCWKCGTTLTDESWKPKPSIDDKTKTGDEEYLGMMWTAHACLVDHKFDLDMKGLDEARHDYVEQADVPNDVANEAWDMVNDMTGEISVECPQFLVNLCLFDFRTAGGGRARRISNWLRKGDYFDNLDGYLRPFEESLPKPVQSLMKLLPGKTLLMEKSTTAISFVAPFGLKKYVAPSRFTVTFPYLMLGTKNDKKTLGLLSLGQDGKSPSFDLKFAFMGSFGFAEPSYTTWDEGKEDEGNEYSGTRLSLGCYSLEPFYLSEVSSRVKLALADNSKHKKGYLDYGGARPSHLERLLAVAKSGGHRLALSWAKHMAQLATAITQRAIFQRRLAYAPRLRDDESPTMPDGSRGLIHFLAFVQSKIDRRIEKLEILRPKSSSLTAFEYIWVQEAALWELLLIGASCLPVDEMCNVVCGEISDWAPPLSADDVSITECVQNIPCGLGKCTFERILTPSGTAAAHCVYESLLSFDYVATGLLPSKDRLHEFTPYFEFYIGGFLGKEDVDDRNSKVGSPAGVQIWVNLSDSLHAQLLDAKVSNREAGGAIAKMLASYLGTGVGSGDGYVVIDFTKFVAEMPNAVSYPVLADLAVELVKAKCAKCVVFLRSGLKYNTGSLDRYQCGEILVYEPDPKNLVAKIHTEAVKIFSKGNQDVPDSKLWQICGEYVSLMKKVYLLSDAIAWQRWVEYAREW